MPPEVTMGDIYRSVTPYVLLMILGMVICAAFPQIVLILPDLLF